MIIGAGIMFLTASGDTLLLKRSADSDNPGSWCFPGGKQDGDETAEQAAVRECEEEIGFVPDGVRSLWTRRIADGVDFTTFLQRVPGAFVPTLNGEHTAFMWARPADLLNGIQEAINPAETL